MRQNPFDDNTADAVLGSPVAPDDVPAGLREVAELVQAARRPASADELVGENAMVARIAAAVGEPAELQPGVGQEGNPVHGMLRKTRVAAAAAALVLVGGTAAAAASGVLPTPVQQSLASGFSKVGISLPHPAELTASHPNNASVKHAKGKFANGHHGLPAPPPPGAFGSVASVDGATAAGSCGKADQAGTFTLTQHKSSTPVTVNVDTTTTFMEPGVTSATFANVCVGEFVAAQGTNTNNVVTATKVGIAPPHVEDHGEGAFGKVASVGGVTTDGACLTGDTGPFTLTSFKGMNTVTVNVSSSTTYSEKGVTSATFANVCVGEFVAAKGTNTNNTVAATQVFIAPPHPAPKPPEGAFGKVASVGGVTTDGACLTSDTGPFTLTSFKGAKTITVNVSSSTTYSEKGVASATFANVCVGEFVGAKGAVSNDTVTATQVFIAPPKPADDGDGHGHDGPKGAFGKVASVNGDSTAGKCLSAADGTFTVTEWKNTTVTVTVERGDEVLRARCEHAVVRERVRRLVRRRRRNRHGYDRCRDEGVRGPGRRQGWRRLRRSRRQGWRRLRRPELRSPPGPGKLGRERLGASSRRSSRATRRAACRRAARPRSRGRVR